MSTPRRDAPPTTPPATPRLSPSEADRALDGILADLLAERARYVDAGHAAGWARALEDELRGFVRDTLGHGPLVAADAVRAARDRGGSAPGSDESADPVWGVAESVAWARLAVRTGQVERLRPNGPVN